MSSQQVGAGAAVLQRMRKDAGMTQERLAEASGVSVRTVRGLETGSIRHPHRPTLLAIAAGLGLDQPKISELVRTRASDGAALPFAEVLDPRADVEAMIARFGERTALPFSDVTWSTRAVIGPDRHCLFRETHLVKRAELEGADSLMFLFGGDRAYDATRLMVQPLHGCVVGELIPLPESNEIVYFLDVGAPVPVGETVSVGYRIDMVPARRPTDELAAAGHADTPAETAVDVTFRGRMAQLVIDVDFRGSETPSAIWQTRGEGDDRVRVRALEAGAFGSVHVIGTNLEPGVHGIEWDWG